LAALKRNEGKTRNRHDDEIHQQIFEREQIGHDRLVMLTS